MITIQIYMWCFENGLLYWVSLPDTDWQAMTANKKGTASRIPVIPSAASVWILRKQ